MSDGDVMARLWAVVPAGGSGTRLWPLSRQHRPKFLLDLTGSGQSLLQETLGRLEPLVGSRALVVTGTRHGAAVRAQLPQLSERNVLLEPAPRDSMPAIGWAAAVVEREDPDALVGSFPADHVIGDSAAFRACVTQAAHAATASDQLVTLGVRPHYPATGFGYIRSTDPAGIGAAPTAHHVSSFTEKPAADRAGELMAEGALWNAGMFVAKARVILDLLATWHPDLAATLRRLAARPEEADRAWPEISPITIDHAIAEPAAAAGRVLVVPATFPWDDVGDFASLASVLEDSDEHPGLRVLGPAEHALGHASSGLVAARSGRTVVTMGMPDVVVIDTDDVVLVTTREQAQDVRGIVDTLRRRGREDLT